MQTAPKSLLRWIRSDLGAVVMMPKRLVMVTVIMKGMMLNHRPYLLILTPMAVVSRLPVVLRSI
jgi:hypothetical protein